MKYIMFAILLEIVLVACPHRPEVAGAVAAAPEATAAQEIISEAAAAPEAAPSEDQQTP